jgi:hypothetical protein
VSPFTLLIGGGMSPKAVLEFVDRRKIYYALVEKRTSIPLPFSLWPL